MVHIISRFMAFGLRGQRVSSYLTEDRADPLRLFLGPFRVQARLFELGGARV